MPIRAPKNEILSAVQAALRAEAEAAAGGNGVLSRAEQAAMPDGLLEEAARKVREERGPGARVDVDAMAAKATRRTAALLGRVNQRSGAGAASISQREIQALHGIDAEAGVRVARAYELLTGKPVELGPRSAPSASVLETLRPSLGTEAPRVRGEIEIFNESGDNGVNTFANELPGATTIDDAIASAQDRWSRWGFNHWDMQVQPATGAAAITAFLDVARGLYAEEDRDPAEVGPIVDAFADRVERTFGALPDVRLVTGADVDSERGGTYLFGKTSDGWVALAVRQYRDG
ncbi:hypothetical protein L6R52_08240 [Myxococcota bacterium]|nr:hypothetical protein [Myxococcota bacterium]